MRIRCEGETRLMFIVSLTFRGLDYLASTAVGSTPFRAHLERSLFVGSTPFRACLDGRSFVGSMPIRACLDGRF